MDTVLKVMGAALGILVPVLFIYAINKGINRSPLEASEKRSSKRILIGATTLWTVTVWALSLAGVFSYHAGDAFPRVLIALFLPVAAGLIALRSQRFRTILDHTPLSVLVGVQSFRFAGAAFLIIVQLGILPAAFASGGYGDLTTGALAVVASFLLARGSTTGTRAAFWGFTVAGLFDLANVAFLLLRFYPTWYQGTPTSAPMADFSLIMIPAIAAPIALLLHTYAIRCAVVSARAGGLRESGPCVLRKADA